MIRCSVMAMPAPGLPAAVSSTWVVSFPGMLFLHHIGQPQLRDLGNFLQGRDDFLLWRVMHSLLHGPEDGYHVVQSRADDEGKAEACAVGGIERLDLLHQV